MEAHVHVIVEGMVQGVGFRWFVATRAQDLGLNGYVKNLYDGSVEIEAVGNRSLIEELLSKLKVGPRAAHVTNLCISWLESSSDKQRFTHFEIR
ncbi:MAG: acylphosphatase [Ignavibacteriae bacterium]|nr:acylphosphatase [Ignavibacteriota bacterium]